MPDNIENDIELTNLLKAGDSGAFDSIYSKYGRVLYLYLLDRLDDHDLCSDILQDIFVSLWEKRGRLIIEVSIKAYLFQAARFKIADVYRKKHRYEKYLLELGDHIDTGYSFITEDIDSKKQLASVMNTIDAFPLRMKEIFILSRFQHLTVNAIAAKLSISPQTVKNQISKALNLLREYKAGSFLIFCTLGYLLFC